MLIHSGRTISTQHLAPFVRLHPHGQVWLPTARCTLQQLKVVLLEDAQKAWVREQGDDSDAESIDSQHGDAPGYHTFDTAAQFLTDLGKGISGGGNKGSDAIIPDRHFYDKPLKGTVDGAQLFYVPNRYSQSLRDTALK